MPPNVEDSIVEAYKDWWTGRNARPVVYYRYTTEESTSARSDLFLDL